MRLKQTAVSGTMESSDVMVTLAPNGGGGIEIELNSPVEKQFGREMRDVIRETLKGLGVKDAKVKAVDKGALDCVIRARVKTAAYRASGESEYIWEGARK
ncbi:citrate lyase acyl carrier protein [Caproiciproducens sp. NJN-50]|uniref:citrate lyase acyl carrier protein n=1 Tax=Acutalibacteraceae TaxID=3082771 RepID=UPI000FFE2429|nr:MULTISPECIES: citrate lyase acyl carrier protein [Acutalibacteraceae]QAT48758.1 citrate lyase acyl carrier protein [Caproiciproducens sp. NJN-50]